MYFKKLLPFILITALISTSPVVFSQSDPGDPSIDDPAVPIDGGISLLLAAGAALGAGKLYSKGRQEMD